MTDADKVADLERQLADMRKSRDYHASQHEKLRGEMRDMMEARSKALKDGARWLEENERLKDRVEALNRERKSLDLRVCAGEQNLRNAHQTILYANEGGARATAERDAARQEVEVALRDFRARAEAECINAAELAQDATVPLPDAVQKMTPRQVSSASAKALAKRIAALPLRIR